MTVHDSRRRLAGFRLVVATAVAVMFTGGSIIFATPVLASPQLSRTLAAAFTADECEGTEYSPESQTLDISGVRLEHYNDGNIVPMYGSNEGGTSLVTSAPVCGVREIIGVEAKSEWMYCTDLDLDPCSGVDGEGLPVDKHQTVMGPTEPSSGNLDLTENDQLVISWLLQNPAMWGDDIADNSSENSRSARQLLVWCISDYDNAMMWDYHDQCEESLGAAEQSRIAALMKTTPTLDLVRKMPSTETLDIGDTAVFALSTNMFGKQINVEASAGAILTVCGRNQGAWLNGNTLTVDGDGSVAKEIELCLSVKTAGEHSVTVDVVPDAVENLHWNTAGAHCQVFASFDTVRSHRINVEAIVEYNAAPVTATPLATPVIIVPIIPVISIIVPVPAPAQPVVVVPASVVQAPAPTLIAAPRQATGPRPIAIDGGGAEQDSRSISGSAFGAAGLIGVAVAGVSAIRRRA